MKRKLEKQLIGRNKEKSANDRGKERWKKWQNQRNARFVVEKQH